jgi:hypothetical protein
VVDQWENHLVAVLSPFDPFYGFEKEVAACTHAAFYHPGDYPGRPDFGASFQKCFSATKTMS